MESGKQSNSSSEENDQSSEQVNDDIGTGRSYECIFCKRGFTNAQALGGHMNIHRKDRAKTKQVVTPSSNVLSSSSSSHVPPNKPLVEDHFTSSRMFFPPQVSCDQTPHVFVGMEAQRNYQMYLQSSPTSPRRITTRTYNFEASIDHDLHVPRSSPFSLNEEGFGVNLNLQIGPSRGEENKEDQKEDKLDLELRLGHHP
ncbi:hypothetical protein RJ641_003913 [Dillenia turbinata]|uniref:C2H2-type domain-containing protein n=1 Tax=Dillenia turbinata TaxID=194707 RepID=A0AAN8Z7S4_9MAGN